MSTVQVLTDELYEDFLSGRKSAESYLGLEVHPTLPRQWKVQSNDPTTISSLDSVSRTGAVSVFGFDALATEAEEVGKKILFMEDPTEVFEWKKSLSDEPGVAVESKLDGRLDRNGTPLQLVNGFLPFQAVGVNFQKSCDRCVYFQWSTGTGKTLAAEGTILWRRENGYEGGTKGFDLCLYVVKPNNLYNTRRKLADHTGLDSRILGGTPKRRQRLFGEAAAAMEAGEQPILIFNAEKFREDTEFFKLLVEGKNVLVIFDEMPEKYANRMTALYRATAEVFYTSFTTPSQGKSKGKQVFYPKAGDDRTKQTFFVGMCATPIRNSPEDWFNCCRLMDSRIYGPIDNFNNHFVARRDRWHNVAAWTNLDLMGAMAAHIVHQVDKKKQPEVASQFPEKLPPEIDYCDMDPATEWLYGKLQSEYNNLGLAGLLDLDEILAAIGVLQMICNNPRSVLDSAKKYEVYETKLRAMLAKMADEGASDEEIDHAYDDFKKKYRDGSEVAYKFRAMINNDAKFTDKDAKGECVISKMIKLRERIEQHDDKVIVFTDKNETLIPYIAEWFDKWGISYIEYHGGLNAKQKQEAQDKFRQDPSVKVFLGSDAGKDSIDLPEASLTIHYSDPWTAAAKEQRGNRQDRIDSEKDVVQEITLQVPYTVEDRKDEIISIKQGYHDQVFGSGEIAEQARDLTKKDYLYMLTGER